MKRNEDSLRDIWDNIKHINIHIIGVTERQEKEKGTEKIFEEIIANMSLTWERKVIQVQETQSLRQDKPKEEHAETHSIQIDKN